jgi:hypothetical protein
MKIRPVGAELIHPDGQTYMTKLAAVFRNFANAPKNAWNYNVKQCTSAQSLYYIREYKATCFDYNLVIFRPILTFVLPDAMHTLGSHRVYTHGIYLIKMFV